jgi:hypothetical protein
MFAADLAVLVTAASLALADAGIEMVDLVAATSLVSEECRLCVVLANEKQGLALHCCRSAVNHSLDALHFKVFFEVQALPSCQSSTFLVEWSECL